MLKKYINEHFIKNFLDFKNQVFINFFNYYRMRWLCFLNMGQMDNNNNINLMIAIKMNNKCLMNNLSNSKCLMLISIYMMVKINFYNIFLNKGISFIIFVNIHIHLLKNNCYNF